MPDISLTHQAWLALPLLGAGLFAGFMAGLFGIGGGAILVPAFYQVFGLFGVDDAVRMHISVGTSLAVIVPTSIRSLMAHHRRGAVDMSLLRSFLIAVPTGVVVASLVFSMISGTSLRLLFAVFAGLFSIRLMLNRESWKLGDDVPEGAARFTVGALIGFFSTLMGIGGGVLNNTFMTMFNRPIHQAVATSAGVGVLIAVPGVIGSIWAGWGEAGLPELSTGFVNWVAVALIIPVTLLVAPLGAHTAHKLKKRQLEIGFGIFLFVVSVRFFYSVL